MKRKSILALILAAIIIFSISLVGCGGSDNTKTGNNAAGNPNTANNATGNTDGDMDRNNAIGNPNTANNAIGNMDGNIDRNNPTGNPDIANNATGNIDEYNTTGNTGWNNAMGNTNGPSANRPNSDTTNNTTDNYTGSTGDSLNYTATNFRDDVVNAGYKINDSANSKKNYFSGNETDYLMGNDVVRVYEYNSADDLEGDINRIAPNGLTINGTDANYTQKPHFYKSGNSLIVYEGNEPAYTDHFKNMYGDTLIP